MAVFEAEKNGVLLTNDPSKVNLEDVCDLIEKQYWGPSRVRRTTKKAFENSRDNRGLSFVEIVATCNSGWKMSPVDANKWMSEHMFEVYPLGDLKDI